MRAPLFTLGAFVTALVLQGCEGCNDNQIDPKLDEEDVFTNDIGSWLSMALTPEGKPAIAYYDRTMGALGYAVGTVDSAGKVTWAREEVDSYPDDNGLNPGDAGRYASMKIAASGQVWIAYQDVSNGTLKYAHKGDGVWEIGVADIGGGAKTDAGYWASLALDSAGNPVIAHFDQGKGNLRVARWNGTTFAGAIAAEGAEHTPDTGGETTPATVGEYANLTIASDGTEYIAYYDRAAGALMLASGKSGTYDTEVVDDSGDVGQWPSLVIDGVDTWIAYQDVGKQDLRVASGHPGSWDIEVVDEGDHIGADAALFVDDAKPGVIYFDGFQNNMKLARSSGSSWTTEKLAGDAGAVGFHNETVKIGTTRYVACYDYTARSVFFATLP
jgi:hypothetical protein